MSRRCLIARRSLWLVVRRLWNVCRRASWLIVCTRRRWLVLVRTPSPLSFLPGCSLSVILRHGLLEHRIVGFFRNLLCLPGLPPRGIQASRSSWLAMPLGCSLSLILRHGLVVRRIVGLFRSLLCLPGLRPRGIQAGRPFWLASIVVAAVLLLILLLLWS